MVHGVVVQMATRTSGRLELAALKPGALSTTLKLGNAFDVILGIILSLG